ncbi:MAG: [acyl-carrier-protein] S-malonyltransferase [Chlamydiae bacterium RIFCSPHIGHO2_12_FULL_49_9]|nr:MAG: [acyl-carrier-protein] S-malonyltransferase [Chlamydiae bacterium RIFCSPHIGHO2_12_FULL_49_9]
MTKKKIAFLFPGQGAQYPQMGKDFYGAFPIAKETFQEADDLLEEKLSKIIFEGPEDLLTETKYSQTGIFVVSMAILRSAQKEHPRLIPSVCSGLSLGEYTALCASDRLDFADTLRLVKERARLMNHACEITAGTMAAVLGMNGPDVEEALRGSDGVWVANYNAPGQIVISGTKEGVEKGSRILKERGAKRVLPLSVHGAFHSGLMKSAQEGLAPYIAKAPIRDSSIEFVMNVPGQFVRSVDEIRKNLACQVTQSVKWEQGVEAMKKAGVEFYLEMGCGKTLSGLNRKIGAAPSFSIDKVTDLEGVFKELGL